MVRTAVAVAVLLSLSVGVATAAVRPFPRLPSECSRSDFESGDVTVRAALCLPSGNGRVPAAIVLHGCGGFDTFDHRLAVDLPHAGLATLYVDYFGPTPPPDGKGFCAGGGGFGTFGIWQAEVLAAAAHLRSLPRIDPRSLAVIGWSLGGGLAVQTVAAHPRLFQALVGFSTGFFGRIGSVLKLPPTLLLSGGPHDAVPLSATEDLYRALRSAGVKVQLYDYGHGVHSWPGAQGTAGIDVAERFLRRTLAP